MPHVAELGRALKRKHPGMYDAMPDDRLGTALKRKYPGSYGQFSEARQSAAIPTVPERPQSLSVQMRQLVEGKRRVVMFPTGTPPMARPRGMAVYADQIGNVFVYDPRLTSQREIESAVETNSLTRLLGATDGGMGAPDKTALSGPALNVVAQDQHGEPVQSTATDPPHLGDAVRQSRKIAPRGGRVAIEDPGAEIARRLR